LRGEAFDHLRGVLHVVGHGLDRVDGFHHLIATFTGGVGRLVRGFGGRHGVTCHLLHCGGHLVDGGSSLFDFIVLLLQAAGGFFGDGAELFGGGAQLRGGTGDLFDGFAQVGLHRREGCEQARRFVIAVDFDKLGQVAIGDGLRGRHGAVQWRDDAAGQQQRQQHRRQSGNDRHHDDAGDGAVVKLAGLTGGGFRISRVDRDEFVELLTHLVGAVLDLRVDQRTHFIDLVLTRQLQHLVLRLHVVVERRGKGLIQRLLFTARRKRRVGGLRAAHLIHQIVDAALRFLQGRRFTVDQNPE